MIGYAGFAERRFSGTEDSRLSRVDGFIRENLASSISLQAIAREAGLSRFHLLRLFKQAYGETPFKRLTRLRMEEAQRRAATPSDAQRRPATVDAHDGVGDRGRLRLRLRRFGALRFRLPTDVRPRADGLSTTGPIATSSLPRQTTEALSRTACSCPCLGLHIARQIVRARPRAMILRLSPCQSARTSHLS
ncbi:MAG: hypothetical protein JWN44_5369 [Myxococcales bacterium]|nr:hypothetical protein [Myxococcales bacterium]